MPIMLSVVAMKTENFAEGSGSRQQLLQSLLHYRLGLSVEALAGKLGISRNAVRQHLIALERDGLVARGKALPSGGRPEQLYVLTARAMEQFPRQYSWFAELLLQELASLAGTKGLTAKLEAMGRKVAKSVSGKLSGPALSRERIASIAGLMNELGYEASAPSADGHTIEAFNCVYHNLAARNRDICAFDLALLSESAGGKVEHQSCMVRGGASCKFRFRPRKG